ncbi:hypothetical protein PAXRUDRAFT_171286 [Paxillus rubicundulus Ve08.2h10]|uniref:Uncharacterized protein n=1 Tax=Paxillus rubicundulus Ve08.2h10 TaxID=930991 RepID=A0A0D0CXM1_9AGAM|nr:hypothetical protein PAXRUDRAFT_171286 [Paxillus rubicundulus Ve08.2h10]
MVSDGHDGQPILPWSSPMGQPILYVPFSPGPSHTSQLPSLSPPIAPWPYSMGQPILYNPPSLGHPIPHSCHFLAHPLHPIKFQCYTLHMYCYILSYLTLGRPIHYGQLHPWAHP